MPEYKIDCPSKIGFISIKLKLNHEKPTLIFKIKYEHKDYFSKKENTPTAGYDYLKFHSKIERDDEYIYLTVNGAQKVYAALKFFLNDPHYGTEKNQDVQEKLRAHLPYFEQQFYKFRYTNISKIIEPPSNIQAQSHSTHKTAIIPTKQGKLYIYKESFTGSKLSAYEAFFGYCYLLLLGPKHAPKVKVAFDKNKARIGVLSKFFSEFVPFYSFSTDDHSLQRLTSEKVLSTKIVETWVTAYSLQEDDLHTNNYGLNSKLQPTDAIKIDSDRTFIPLVAKYHALSDKENRGTYFIDKKPFDIKPAAKSFAASAADLREEIIQFPHLTVSTPFHWLRIAHQPKINKILLSVLNHPNYKQTYYRQFFKTIVLTKFMLNAIKYFPELPLKARRHLENHFKNLKEALLPIFTYQLLALNTPQILEELKQEINEVNREFKKSNHPLRVDLEQLTSAYHNHLEEVQQSCLQLALSKFTEINELTSMLEALPMLGVADNYFLIIEALSQQNSAALKLLFAQAIKYYSAENIGLQPEKLALLTGIYNYLIKENYIISKDRSNTVISLLILSTTSTSTHELIAAITAQLTHLPTGFLGRSYLRESILQQFENISAQPLQLKY